MKLIILGPPGSGKGTVSERLAKEFKLYHLSVGEMLRKEAKKNTAQGKKIRSYIEKGDLVPPKIAVDIVKQKIAKKANYILDGFPRSLQQAKIFEGNHFDAAIYLHLSQPKVIERLSGRLLDPHTGKIYHRLYLPPPKNISKRLIQRKDDQPLVIKERFKVYHRETEPVIKFYQQKKILLKVDASGTPNQVYALVKKELLEHIQHKIKLYKQLS